LHSCNIAAAAAAAAATMGLDSTSTRYWANIAKLREQFSAVNIACQRCRLCHLSFPHSWPFCFLPACQFSLFIFISFSKICHMSGGKISLGLLLGVGSLKKMCHTIAESNE